MTLLGELDVPKRLKKVLESLQHRVQVFEVKEKIDTQVREEFSRHQREAVLRQKLKAIQEELGELDDGEDVSEFDEKIKAAGMPEEAEKVARKQLERLKGMPAASAEYTVTRTYLEWLVELPWSKRTDDRLDLAEARAILDSDHYDLQKVKQRILEYLAVRKLAPQKKGPILCLVGPPGVGKTSLGKSIARALGREFVRISLGGVRDEAEIRGHRRTYIGALPGRIIQGMKRAGIAQPGLHARRDRQAGRRFPRRPGGGAARGARSGAEQHLHAITTSRCRSICRTSSSSPRRTCSTRSRRRCSTAWRCSSCPATRARRSCEIAQAYLVPKQLAEHGLTASRSSSPTQALDEIIEHYTREAGVRNLEREIASVIRGIAVKVAADETVSPVTAATRSRSILGPSVLFARSPSAPSSRAWPRASPGRRRAATSSSSRSPRMPGKGQLDPHRPAGRRHEGVGAGGAVVRARARERARDPRRLLRGATSTCTCPRAPSRRTGRRPASRSSRRWCRCSPGERVRGDVAMTGEITLRGTVLPVGGIKEKLLAAHRAGIKRVILPERNAKDVIDIPRRPAPRWTSSSSRRSTKRWS